MNIFHSAVLDSSHPLNDPPEYFRYKRKRRGWRKGKSCPYCLWDLTDYDFEDLGFVCPLCRHAILEHLLITPIYQFSRAQQWDLLVNEMEYIWKAEHLDVDSYIFGMGGYYNPDYGEAKERLFGMLAEKEALLRLGEEFIEAEGEMDLLMIAHLNKINVWRGNLAGPLFARHPWRIKARRLSVSVPSERERVEFQLGLIGVSPWGAFGSPEKKEETVIYLEKMLGKLSREQGDLGA